MSKDIAAKNELTQEEAALRAEIEPKIKANIRSFRETGELLAIMSDRRLYRNTHSSFKEYVEDVYKIAVRTAYEAIEHAELLKAIPADCAKFAQTANPAQTRALAEVPEEKRGEIIKAVSAKGPVTAKAIRQAAAEAAEPPRVVAHTEVMPPERPPVTADTLANAYANLSRTPAQTADQTPVPPSCSTGAGAVSVDGKWKAAMGGKVIALPPKPNYTPATEKAIDALRVAIEDAKIILDELEANEPDKDALVACQEQLRAAGRAITALCNELGTAKKGAKSK